MSFSENRFPLFRDMRYARLNAGITSLANQRSCSLNSLGGIPSAQWIMKFSRPGYLSAIDLMPSITCAGGPQNQAFCATPSRSEGVRAGAPGERFLLVVRQVDAGTPDHVLAELLLAAVPLAGGVIGAHDVVQDLCTVERHHRLETMARHHVDRLAARDRHPDVDRQVLGPGYHRDLLDPVAAVVDRRRTLVALAFVAKGALVEALEQQLELLLEQLAIGLGVDERRAESFHLPRVIAAADAHDDAPIGHDVGHGVVLGQADRMPHREDVEGAAELEPLGLGGEP